MENSQLVITTLLAPKDFTSHICMFQTLNGRKVLKQAPNSVVVRKEKDKFRVQNPIEPIEMFRFLSQEKEKSVFQPEANLFECYFQIDMVRWVNQ